MKQLSITRAIVGAAVSLHLRSLKIGIARQDRAVNTAMKQTDTARLAEHSCKEWLSNAKGRRRDAVQFERAARSARDTFVTAARAEADNLRRNHTVGA